MNSVFLGKNKIWSPKTSTIKSFYLGWDTVNDYIAFRNIILNNLEFGSTYALLIRVEHSNSKYYMAGNQIGFYFDDKNLDSQIRGVYNEFKLKIKNLTEEYKFEFINSIQLLYVQVNTLPKLRVNNINNVALPKFITDSKDTKSKFKSRFLPLTTNTNYFGKLILDSEANLYLNIINKQKEMLVQEKIARDSYDTMYVYEDQYIILNKQIKNNTYIRDIYSLNLGTFEGSFVDTILDDNTFNRQYKDTILTINSKEVINLVVNRKLATITRDTIKSGKKDDSLVSNPFIGTFDLESFQDDSGFARVYAAGFCVNKKEPLLYYMDSVDYNKKDVLLECIDNMLSEAYDGYLFYVHNLSYDGVFILHKLKLFNDIMGEEHYKVNVFFRDSTILKIEISIDRTLKIRKQNIIGARRRPHDIKITFVDSYNLLNNSLEDLSESFGVLTTKGKFPHKFVNKNTLNYIGVTPDLNYWIDLSQEEYKSIYTPHWNLKLESLFYLKRDIISLFEIMNLFNKYVNRKYNIQLTNCLTISRLSLNIFLKDYLDKFKLPVIKGNLYKDIKEAYYGGVTEVYKPHGKNLYYYDVNSLYPFVSLNSMCGNKYSYIENLNGEGLDLENLFGFFYCEIETSNDYIGYLPVRTIEGLLMPNGKWKGWYFSEELKLAEENNYKIKVIKGHIFNKEDGVFSKYVDTLYTIKSTTTSKVEKAIAKSLLNNLLGRFGMDINKYISEIVNKEQLDYLLSTRDVTCYHTITSNDYLINYSPLVSKDKCDQFGLDYVKVLQDSESSKGNSSEFKDVSLVISAAVTAYARIYMNKIKLAILNKGGQIFYTDTDSIVTDIKLDKDLVGKNLGQFKLEYVVSEGYFISSKTYCLILQEGTFDKNNKSIIKDDSLGKTHWIIIKSKGLINKSLTLSKFIDLYNGINSSGVKRSATTVYSAGSVVINDKIIELQADSYVKRDKIFNNDNKWIDTQPLIIDNPSYSLEDSNTSNSNENTKLNSIKQSFFFK